MIWLRVVNSDTIYRLKVSSFFLFFIFYFTTILCEYVCMCVCVCYPSSSFTIMWELIVWYTVFVWYSEWEIIRDGGGGFILQIYSFMFLYLYLCYMIFSFLPSFVRFMIYISFLFMGHLKMLLWEKGIYENLNPHFYWTEKIKNKYYIYTKMAASLFNSIKAILLFFCFPSKYHIIIYKTKFPHHCF